MAVLPYEPHSTAAMSAFRPKLPWTEIYVRSGLKTLSDSVRRRPTARRVRSAVDDLRTTVLNVARQRLPESTAIAERIVRRVLEKAPGPSSVSNATGIIAPHDFALPLAEPAIAAMNAIAEGYST